MSRLIPLGAVQCIVKCKCNVILKGTDKILPTTFNLLEVRTSSELVETLQEYIPDWALLMLVSWNIMTEVELRTGSRLQE